MVQQQTLLIGVDGGATEIRAHAVACDDLRRPTGFALRPECASQTYERSTDFTPLPLPQQLAATAGRGSCRAAPPGCEISPAERQQGGLWLQAAAEAICDVARQCGNRRVLVGIGMPGLKTADGRGICVINNGPRIPEYLAQLEQRLAASGIELVAPIAALGSDADYCGLGEEYAADGLFRGVRNAYYVGCGTGIADAMKLAGRLVPFDQAKSWILKSWQIPSALGPTFEQLVSAASLNRIYASLTAGLSCGPAEQSRGGSPRSTAKWAKSWKSLGHQPSVSEGHSSTPAHSAGSQSRRGDEGERRGNEGNPGAPAQRGNEVQRIRARSASEGRGSPEPRPADAPRMGQDDSTAGPIPAACPEHAAVAGEPRASIWMAAAALTMAELIFERLWTIKNGRTETPHRGPAYLQLNPQHEFRGTILERIVVGQRIGQIYGDPEYQNIFGDKLDAALAAFIFGCGDAELAKACLVGGTVSELRCGFLTASRLRAAPALGAAVAAVRALPASG